jgi:hypothetical protein
MQVSSVSDSRLAQRYVTGSAPGHFAMINAVVRPLRYFGAILRYKNSVTLIALRM